jgi:A/G-specific adenine glycosylase
MHAQSTRNHHSRSVQKKASTAALLLAWYDANRRELVWRAKPGEAVDPYRVWLSEIMLQQTTVAAVTPYYRAFLKRWPDVKHLARASLDEVCAAWAGLGYYSRARNLWRAAQMVATQMGGAFPTTADGLRALPGVGAYSAAAIAAIAFGERVAAMDANAERVIARLFAIAEALPKARPKLTELATAVVPKNRPGDFAQALMDLGSAVCLSRRPRCGECPLSAGCRARQLGIAETLPRKAAKRPRPLKRGAAFVAVDRLGAVYLVRRPENGLLGGMLQPPLGQWGAAFPARAVALEEAPFTGNWLKKPGLVRHGFTHFELEMEVYVANFSRRPNGEGMWLRVPDLASAALPTVMRKALAHALNEDVSLFKIS